MVGAKSSLDSLPPFPDDVPTAPIAGISSLKLLNGDLSEGAKVLEACQTYGFFYLDLRDSTEGETLLDESEQLLQLAVEAFKDSLAEKMKYRLPKGVSIFGYKPAGTIKKTDPNLRPDTTEFFNISKDHMHDIVPHAFTKNGHECGMLVLRTLETQLGLAPNELVNLSAFEKPAGDHCRLTRKFPRSADAKAIGLPSHTDTGSVTVLFNWLGGLQIENRSAGGEREWEFVRPMAGHAVINLGDAMVKFTNGALKSAKHRVVPPPGEQRSLDRYSVAYFVRPCNTSLMKPVGRFENGTHVKVGGKVSVDDDDNKVYTAGEWMVKKAIQLGS